MKSTAPNKIVIIGAGYVGATTAFTLMHSGLISELVLIDIDQKKAEGEVMDLNHSLSFLKPMTMNKKYKIKTELSEPIKKSG